MSAIRVALVTGATGFIGSHLTRRLVQDGWQVHIVSRAGSHLPNVLEFSEVTNHVHDGSTESMVDLVRNAKPDVVFHLASLFLSGHGPKDVAGLIQSNVLFSTQLLEAMSETGVIGLVNTGTSWQHYENRGYSPVNLYAATKQAFEAILQYYIEARSMKAITLKLFDTYGPNDPRPKLLHLLEKVARSNEPLAMSPGEQLIDLVHVDDVISAYLIAAQRLLSSQVNKYESYAVSSGRPLPLKDLVGIYEEMVGSTLPIRWGERPYRKREVMETWNRGNLMPGWQPAVSLKDGLSQLMGNSA